MKKISLLFINLYFVVSLNGQVGINTRVPYVNSILHIDAKGNNVSATSVSSMEAVDDIVIDKKGNIGVGTVNPTTKLHIDATVGGLNAIRIADGSEGPNKYLFSDYDGKVTWKPKPMPQGIVYYSITKQTFTKGVFTKLPVEVNPLGSFDIRIPYEGSYIVTLRWWGGVVVPSTTIGKYRIASGELELRRTRAGVTTTVDKTVFYSPVEESGPTTTRLTFTISLFASDVDKDDILSLYVKPTGADNWVTGAGLASNQETQTIYYPSVMVYNI